MFFLSLISLFLIPSPFFFSLFLTPSLLFRRPLHIRRRSRPRPPRLPQHRLLLLSPSSTLTLTVSSPPAPPSLTLTLTLTLPSPSPLPRLHPPVICIVGGPSYPYELLLLPVVLVVNEIFLVEAYSRSSMGFDDDTDDDNEF